MTDPNCSKCDGYGFVREVREGTNYPYFCSECNEFVPEEDKYTEAIDAFRKHGKDIPVTEEV